MSKKGDTKYQERPLSDQELRLLDTQNQMQQEQIAIARQQDDRSQAMYDDWRNNFRSIETGEMSPTARRENGYSNNPNILTQDEYDGYMKRKQELESSASRERQRERPVVSGTLDLIDRSRGKGV